MRIVVAMSGGVDSSVTAQMLVEQGHDVTGVFLRNGISSTSRGLKQGCCSARDACDAEEVAGILGIPFYSLDHSVAFESIVRSFVDDYATGRTPNPCVLCNRDLKFGELWDFAAAMGADRIATGHYARCETNARGEVELRRAVDLRKDQSYVLAMVSREALARSVFPLGEMHKQAVRERARMAGLPLFEKPESQEICFVPTGDYRDVLQQRRPELFRDGEIVNEAGEAIACHGGAAGFTVGQRRGLGVGGGHEPLFVLRTEPDANRVVVGPRSTLGTRSGTISGVQWVAAEPAGSGSRDLGLQVRAHHQPVTARVRWQRPDRVEVALEEPEVLVPGQFGVLYEGDRVLAGGQFTREDPAP